MEVRLIMANEKVYQEIFDDLSKYLLPGWEKMVVYLEYGEASYTFSFYLKIKGKYVKCYDLPEVSDEELAESFKEIDKVVSKSRNRGKDLWSNMTMIVDNAGSMHTDFDYTDLSEGTYNYKKEWKKKYLQ